jgi:hypothetical protein
VGRALKNLVKIEKIGRLTLDRLRSWSGSNDEELMMAIRWLDQSLQANVEAISRMNILVDREWFPPKKSASIVFSEDDEVQISPKYRDKYLEVYGTKIVDALVVSKILPTGEIAVRHGRATPFIVAKSHLQLRRQEEIE